MSEIKQIYHKIIVRVKSTPFFLVSGKFKPDIAFFLYAFSIPHARTMFVSNHSSINS